MVEFVVFFNFNCIYNLFVKLNYLEFFQKQKYYNIYNKIHKGKKHKYNIKNKCIILQYITFKNTNLVL